MKFKIFTLYPAIFESFLSVSLIARGIAKDIISVDLIDWRATHGIGNYKQVDDKPFGGGSGMVLMCDPIIRSMQENDAINFDYSTLNTGLNSDNSTKVVPNNSIFEDIIIANRAKFELDNNESQIRKVNILTTPRGFPFDQRVANWLAKEFDEVSILCGRFEGFDNRVNDSVDLELSLGNFVLNGGEVASMAMIESISRLIPGFITKDTSVLHDSFSVSNNQYEEFEFENSRLQTKIKMEKIKKTGSSQNFDNVKGQLPVKLFDNNWWLKNILPHIEHPQYTRPLEWNHKKAPEVLLSGDHAKIQKWRLRWW